MVDLGLTIRDTVARQRQIHKVIQLTRQLKGNGLVLSEAEQKQLRAWQNLHRVEESNEQVKARVQELDGYDTSQLGGTIEAL